MVAPIDIRSMGAHLPHMMLNGIHSSEGVLESWAADENAQSSLDGSGHQEVLKTIMIKMRHLQVLVGPVDESRATEERNEVHRDGAHRP